MKENPVGLHQQNEKTYEQTESRIASSDITNYWDRKKSEWLTNEWLFTNRDYGALNDLSSSSDPSISESGSQETNPLVSVIDGFLKDRASFMDEMRNGFPTISTDLNEDK